MLVGIKPITSWVEVMVWLYGIVLILFDLRIVQGVVIYQILTTSNVGFHLSPKLHLFCGQLFFSCNILFSSVVSNA